MRILELGGIEEYRQERHVSLFFFFTTGSFQDMVLNEDHTPE